MRLRRVAPKDIKVPEIRVTAQFDEETYEQFRNSVKQIGAIAPVICCEVEGELILVDGLHRLQEAQRNGDKAVNVAVMPGDMADVLTKNLLLDRMRGKAPPSQMVKVIEYLWKELKLDSEAIAAKTGATRDYIEKLQKVSELTPLCRQALDEEKIGIGQAYALTKLKDPIRQETVLQQCLLYGWKTKELEDFIKTVLETIEEQQEPPTQEAPRVPYKIKCAYCGEEHDIADIANPPTCRGCSGVMFEAIATARREAEATAAAKDDPPPATE